MNDIWTSLKRHKIKAIVFASLSVLVVFVAGVVGWEYRESISLEDIRSYYKRIADMGPWVFFTAMAILPLFWVPVSPFLLLAPVFGTEVGVFGSLCAMVTNMVLSWFVSGKWFRPFFEKLVTRMGYAIPEVSQDSLMGLALTLRITPGVPFPLQNYLLGLARMPLLKYLLVSVPTTGAIASGIVVFGDAIVKGNAKLMLVAVGLIIAISVLVRHLRKRVQPVDLKGGEDESR